jgi:hypothetical protein
LTGANPKKGTQGSDRTGGFLRAAMAGLGDQQAGDGAFFSGRDPLRGSATSAQM